MKKQEIIIETVRGLSAVAVDAYRTCRKFGQPRSVSIAFAAGRCWRVARELAAILVAALLVVGCSAVSVDPSDGGAEPPQDAAQALDVVEAPDAAPEPDSGAQGPLDASTPAPGTCRPDREGGITSIECRRYPDRPICDAISEQCVAPPAALCGACETDAQCQAIDAFARCVFMPGDIPENSDSACLVPCDAGCDWVAEAYGWTAPARCFAFPAGSFCAPDWGGKTHCRNPDSTRQGT